MQTMRAAKWRYGGGIVGLLVLLSTALFGFTAWGENDPAPVPEIPWEVEVYREYCPELTYEAYVADCWTGYADEELHIVAVTDMPTLLPSEMDMIPVVTVAPPAKPPGPLASFPKVVAGYRAACPWLLTEVYIEDCWTGYVGDVLHVVVVTDTPVLVPAVIETMPTFIVPPPSTETEPSTSEVGSSGSPPNGTTLTTPAPLDLRPLLALPGVVGVGRRADHLLVETTEPGRVPATFGGLPVRIDDLFSLPPHSGLQGASTSFFSVVDTYAYSQDLAKPAN